MDVMSETWSAWTFVCRTCRGMRVVTTLNPTLQALAQRDVSQNISNLRWRNVTQGAMVSLDFNPTPADAGSGRASAKD